ncbi:MAG: DUF1648 domain-containing protein [Gemmatimonadetes bacterium]|nr:DUF1648 domain-containing protein [Gemmatimonadota bacterium]
MSRKWLGPMLIVLCFVGTAILYPELPARIPTHWDWRGRVDDTAPRFPGAFLAPLLMAGLWVLLPVLRRIDPRRRNYERFDETFWVLLNVLSVGMLLLQAATLATALEAPFEPGRMVLGGVGILFLVLGNYLPRLRSNWWMGIRTPWTLDSETVWRRTHRLGGWSFAVGGLVCLVAVLLLPLEAAGVAALVALGAAALVPAVFSYIAWRQERHPS